MSTVDFLPQIELETGPYPSYSVIWMHGLGADGNDFVPIVNELVLPLGIHVRFIFPHAPLQPVSINNGYVMRAWYDIRDPDLCRQQDESGIENSRIAIDTLIEREIGRGIVSRNIFLGGFSQGGAMALHTGLHQAKQLAGIIALSCYLPLADSLEAENCHINTAIPIFMAHGANDAIVSISKALSSRDQLLAKDCQIEWHVYLMEHTVCMQEIADISQWIQRVLMNDPGIQNVY